MNIEQRGSEAAEAAFTTLERLHERSFFRPSIAWDLRGRRAGEANFKYEFGNRIKWGQIRLNKGIAKRYPDDFIKETVPHEVAHFVSFELHGRAGCGHGHEWQQVMRQLGLKPKRTHSYAVKPARRLKRYQVACGCPEGRTVTSIVYNRLAAGMEYSCTICNSNLHLGASE